MTMIGVDEVGRGAWAGPLVVGVVRSDPDALAELLKRSSDASNKGNGYAPLYFDSKALSKKRRESLISPIYGKALEIGVGQATAQEVSIFGITKALVVAYQRATTAMSISSDEICLDGKHNYLAEVADRQVHCLIKGDTLNPVVAAASIVAKVHRDSFMYEASRHYPYYGFESNVGYPSRTHINGLQGWGMCPEHRHSWSFARKLPFGPL